MHDYFKLYNELLLNILFNYSIFYKIFWRLFQISRLEASIHQAELNSASLLQQHSLELVGKQEQLDSVERDLVESKEQNRSLDNELSKRHACYDKILHELESMRQDRDDKLKQVCFITLPI